MPGASDGRSCAHASASVTRDARVTCRALGPPLLATVADRDLAAFAPADQLVSRAGQLASEMGPPNSTQLHTQGPAASYHRLSSDGADSADSRASAPTPARPSDSARPEENVAWAAALKELHAAVRRDEAAGAEEQLRIAIFVAFLNQDQRGRSWSPPTVLPVRVKDFDEVATDKLRSALEALERPRSPVVVWNGSRRWCRAALRALRGLSIGVNRVLLGAIVRAIASFAESRTGRCVTAGFEAIARRAKLPAPASGAARKMLQRVYGALQEIGAAVKLTIARRLTPIEQLAAQEHHGGTQKAVSHRLDLVMPGGWDRETAATGVEDGARETAAASAQVGESVHLSVGSYYRSFASVGLKYSSVRKRPRAQSSSERKARRARRAPRPDLATQRLAAELVAPGTGPLQGLHRAYGPDGDRHIGELCSLLLEVGVDPARWSARDLGEVLCQAFKREGRTWIVPDHPRSYLRYWLKKIDFTAPSPTELAQARADAAKVIDAPVAEARERQSRKPSTSAREAAMRAITAVLSPNRRDVMRRKT